MKQKAMLSFHGDRKYCSTFNSTVWSGKLALLSLQGSVQTDEATYTKEILKKQHTNKKTRTKSSPHNLVTTLRQLEF